jgi:choline-sulfatase
MKQKPNIIFILTDDQGAWAMGCAGNQEIHTPHIDALAGRGIRFDNFFCASPVCSPARASLLTGRMPSAHGVHDWIRRGNLVSPVDLPAFAGDDCAIEYLHGMRAYTETLSETGYRCGISGKWHLGDSLHPQKDFSYWNVFPYGGSNHYFNPVMIQDGQVQLVPGYLTDVITKGALRFIDASAGGSQPFYLSVHYTAPHSPWEKGQHPDELTALYQDCPFDTCPDVPSHPWQINSAPRGTGDRRRELLTGYYAAVSGVDRGVGQIVACLRKNNLLENTLLIFSSDNGMNMGHHGVWGKGNGTFPFNMYDTSVKVPFILSWPGMLPESVIDEHLLSHYDFFPTLVDLLGLTEPALAALPGRSFAPLLQGQPLPERDAVVVFDEYGPVRMIRTRTHKYIHRYPYGPNEFYDLVTDPGECENRVTDPSHQPLIAGLRAALDQFFLTYTDPDLDGARQATTGKGQINLAGIRGQGQPVYDGDWWYIDEQGQRINK